MLIYREAIFANCKQWIEKILQGVNILQPAGKLYLFNDKTDTEWGKLQITVEDQLLKSGAHF